MIAQGVGSVYAQLWTKIVIGKVPATPESGIIDMLRAPPLPKPLAVRAATDDVAAPPEKKEAPDAARPVAENEDWETDVVLERVAPPNGGAPRQPAGTGARP